MNQCPKCGAEERKGGSCAEWKCKTFRWGRKLIQSDLCKARQELNEFYALARKYHRGYDAELRAAGEGPPEPVSELEAVRSLLAEENWIHEGTIENLCKEVVSQEKRIAELEKKIEELEPVNTFWTEFQKASLAFGDAARVSETDRLQADAYLNVYESLKSRIGELEAECKRLRRGIWEAIQRPKGVVPEGYYGDYQQARDELTPVGSAKAEGGVG
jgi:hypothetical protein